MRHAYLIYQNSPLTLPIAGKLIPLHIMESLVKLGLSSCTVIGEREEKQQLIDLLGWGERWGLTLDYQTHEWLKEVEDSAILIGNLGELPYIHPLHLNHPQEDVSKLWFYPRQRWSGWGIFSKEQRKKGLDPYALKGMYETLSTTPVISTHTPLDFKESTHRALKQKPLLFPATAKEIAKDIWVSRGSTIDPSAELLAPLFIGDCSKIEKGTVVGPNVAVENHCLIDINTTVTDSVICPHSYVGESLQIHNCIVNKNDLVNLSLNTHIQLKDPTVLSGLSPLTDLWKRWKE